MHVYDNVENFPFIQDIIMGSIIETEYFAGKYDDDYESEISIYYSLLGAVTMYLHGTGTRIESSTRGGIYHIIINRYLSGKPAILFVRKADLNWYSERWNEHTSIYRIANAYFMTYNDSIMLGYHRQEDCLLEDCPVHGYIIE